MVRPGRGEPPGEAAGGRPRPTWRGSGAAARGLKRDGGGMAALLRRRGAAAGPADSGEQREPHPLPGRAAAALGCGRR